MTKRLELLGFPLSHSISPEMQNAALKRFKLPYRYELHEVPPKDLKKVLEKLKKDPQFVGANVTIPHKEAVMKWCDKVGEASQSIGAVNVILRQKNGKLIGDNTDWRGFLDALQEEGIRLEKYQLALVMGAGGGARAVVYALLRKGIRVGIFNRHPQRATQLIRDFKKLGRVTSVRESELLQVARGVHLIVNATSCGMVPDIQRSPFDGIGADRVQFHRGQTVVDLIYNPLETLLLKKAKREGAKAIGGLGMLVHQGARAFQLFTGKKPPLPLMKRIARQAISGKK